MHFQREIAPVPKLIVALTILALAVLALPSASAQTATPTEATRQAELKTAWQAASNAGISGPSELTLIDQVTLKLPADYFFVPKIEGQRVLRALGNVVDDTSFVGVVVGKRQNDEWLVAIRYIKEGYIKDDEAKNWNADELLKNISEGTEQANKDRVARGFPEMQVMGWVEPPAYDASAHRLVWSLLAKHKGEPDDLNLLSSSDRIAGEKPVAHELLDDLRYNAGKRYEDFSATTDRVAEYGLMALVGGAVVKKLGLFALLGAFALKFAKVIILGAVAFGASMMKFLRRKPRGGAAGGAA
jgi:uncharacterized membrane-anchored protein